MRCPAPINAARMVAAKAGVPMKTRSSRRRRCGARSAAVKAIRSPQANLTLSRNERSAALRLGQFAQDHAALQRRDVVDEQGAVEMVDLVLDAGGEDACRVDLADLVLV